MGKKIREPRKQWVEFHHNVKHTVTSFFTSLLERIKPGQDNISDCLAETYQLQATVCDILFIFAM